MKTISLKEIQELEHKIDNILHPLIIGQIKDFVRVYIDKEDKMYPKALQMIAIRVSQIGRDFHEKDLI
jgi:threonyl-tRNA synthetase